MRVPGDTLFTIGAIALAWFVFRETIGRVHQAKPVPRRAPEPVPVVR
jgi:hypothetical protein